MKENDYKRGDLVRYTSPFGRKELLGLITSVEDDLIGVRWNDRNTIEIYCVSRLTSWDVTRLNKK